MAVPDVRITTHTFKVVDEFELTIDVHLPRNFDITGVVILHFHGGFLVLGEKTTFPPNWLINAAHNRSWAYATASYRLLPESKGTEVLADALDATKWVHDHVASRIILAGSSAGGLLALATAANPQAPPLLAVLSIYGMLDLSANRYLEAGMNVGGLSPYTKDQVDVMLKEIREAAKGGQALDGYAFPENPPSDQRFKWIGTMHQEALLPDIISNTPGLSQQIKTQGLEILSSEQQAFFPACFGFTSRFAPMALIHGVEDVHVETEQSLNVAAKLRQLGVDVCLEVVPAQAHGFDVRGVLKYIDIDTVEANEPSFHKSLRRVVAFLDRVVEQSV